jgi:hypothetical protein
MNDHHREQVSFDVCMQFSQFLLDDCEMPRSCDTPLPFDDDPSSPEFSHTRWHDHKFRFAVQIGRIIDLAFPPKHPPYSTIIQLDREIIEYYRNLPAWMLCPAVTSPVKELPQQGLANPQEMRKHAQIFSLANMIFLTILHLHRGPFCRALMGGPKDLIKSPYESSVVSVTGVSYLAAPAFPLQLTRFRRLGL